MAKWAEDLKKAAAAKAGIPPKDPRDLAQPMAIVALGITRGAGEAYGWRRYALLLGPAGWPECEELHQGSPEYRDALERYARRRFRKLKLEYEGLGCWTAKRLIAWPSGHWLPDPIRPRT